MSSIIFSRRFFLCSLFAVPLVADETKNVPEHWAFISDTHISNGGKTVDNMQKVITEIAELPKTNRLIICGDCAEDAGLPSDYRTLFDALKPLRKKKVPIHFVMGNHDNRHNFLSVLAETLKRDEPKETPDKLYEVIETEYLNLFLLDSLEKTKQQSGSLGKEQLDWLVSELDKRQQKPAVLVFHHYPDYTSGWLRNPHALQDTGELFNVIKERKQVKVCFFGHSHSWKVLQKDGICLVNIPAVSWAVDKRQPLGWVHAVIDEKEITLTLHSLEKEHPKHLETVNILLAEKTK